MINPTKNGKKLVKIYRGGAADLAKTEGGFGCKRYIHRL